MKELSPADMATWAGDLRDKYGIPFPVDLPEDNDEETHA